MFDLFVKGEERGKYRRKIGLQKLKQTSYCNICKEGNI